MFEKTKMLQIRGLTFAKAVQSRATCGHGSALGLVGVMTKLGADYAAFLLFLLLMLPSSISLAGSQNVNRDAPVLSSFTPSGGEYLEGAPVLKDLLLHPDFFPVPEPEHIDVVAITGHTTLEGALPAPFFSTVPSPSLLVNWQPS